MDETLKKQKNHFDRVSAQYFKARQNENHLLFKELMWKYFFKKTRKFFIFNKKYKLLEPMCGYGEGYKILKNYACLDIDYKGFDYSEEMVRAAMNSPELNVVHGNILNYFDDNRYDLIILIGGLHHVYRYADLALKNVSKLIKNNGLFISLEPTHNNWFFQKVREIIYKTNGFFDEDSEKAFKLEELNDLFINNGYQKIIQIYPGLLGYILYYNPDAFKNLNIGNKKVVKVIFNIEKYFYDTLFGRYFSFCTLTLWRKGEFLNEN